MQQHHLYCENKIATPGSIHYYSLLYTTAEQRTALTAIYAFCEEVMHAVIDCSETEIAIRKLDWWYEELGRCFRQQPQHPISHVLQQPIEQHTLPKEYFDEILDGVKMSLEQTVYEQFDDLRLPCYRLGSVPCLLATEVLGYQDRTATNYATDLGIALQLTRTIHQLRVAIMRGQLMIPLTDLEQHSLQPESLINNDNPAHLQALIADQAKRARDYFQRAEQHLSKTDRKTLLPLRILANIHLALLTAIENDGYRVLDVKTDLTPLRMFWITWRTKTGGLGY
ncbi:MAG: squalene/phytoene synthase family protein [Gammaproteobacteria bacterium]